MLHIISPYGDFQTNAQSTDALNQALFLNKKKKKKTPNASVNQVGDATDALTKQSNLFKQCVLSFFFFFKKKKVCGQRNQILSSSNELERSRFLICEGHICPFTFFFWINLSLTYKEPPHFQLI
jgi:hypothetical protein